MIAPRLAPCLEQEPSILEVFRVESLGEPAADRREQIVSSSTPAASGEQLGQRYSRQNFLAGGLNAGGTLEAASRRIEFLPRDSPSPISACATGVVDPLDRKYSNSQAGAQEA